MKKNSEYKVDMIYILLWCLEEIAFVISGILVFGGTLGFVMGVECSTHRCVYLYLPCYDFIKKKLIFIKVNFNTRTIHFFLKKSETFNYQRGIASTPFP